MEEAIVMKIIIGLTIIIILGFIYLLRENKVLDSKVSWSVGRGRAEEYEYKLNRLKERLTEQVHRVSTMNHRLDAYELRLEEYEHRLSQQDEINGQIRDRVDEHRHRLSQQDELIAQIRHRVDAHEVRLYT